MSNTKRLLSIVMAVLMCVSMFTGIMLPASAETAKATDAYAAINATDNGDGTYTPAANVYFVDAAFGTAPSGVSNGDKYTYTYGGNSWGNGKKYVLTWGTNTLKDYAAAQKVAKDYSKTWAANPTGSNELVFVFAPGKLTANAAYGDSDRGSTMTAAATDPTKDQVLNITFLGPQAGRSPVPADHQDSLAAAKAVANGRSVNTTKEYVFAGTYYVPEKAVTTWDGFAVSGAGKIYSDRKYSALYFKNLYVGYEGKVAKPSGNQLIAILADNNIFHVYDSYFKLDGVLPDEAGLPVNSNDTVIENCVFSDGKMSTKHANNQTWHMQFYPNNATAASANFYGAELAAKPVFEFTGCSVVDWESCHVLRFLVDNARVASYEDHAYTINILNNKFRDCTKYTTGMGDVIFTNKVTKADQVDSYTLNIQGNYFGHSDSEAFTSRTENLVDINFFGSVDKENGTDIRKHYDYRIYDNIFQSPVTTKTMNAYSIAAMADFSGNLFMDNQGNIQPMKASYVSGYTSNATVQSDMYADDTMTVGVRELMTVTEVENGIVAYSHIQRIATPGKQGTRKYLRGNVTVVLDREKTQNPDSLLRFGNPDVKFEGVYNDEECTEKVDSISMDTVNGKYAKATYKKGSTTLTVVYGLSTPTKYIVVDPEDRFGTTGYTFNGITYPKNGAGSDGITTEWVSAFVGGSGGYSKTVTPNIGDSAGCHSFGMSTVVLMAPGVHSTAAGASQQMGKSMCALGPQWNKNPFDKELAKTGAYANGRSFDPETEALVQFYFQPAADNSLSFVFAGMASEGAQAFVNNKNSGMLSTCFQDIRIENCMIRNSRDARAPIFNSEDNSSTGNKQLHLTLRGVVYDGKDITHAKSDVLMFTRATWVDMEEFAVMNDKSVAAHRVIYATLINGEKARTGKPRLKIDNSVIYNSNRDLALYTLRDTTTINANFKCWPAGAELILTNNYIKDGTGYFFGIQNGEQTGVDKFTKVTAIGNVFDRPNYTGNTIAHWNTATQYRGDPYMDGSVFSKNAFIVSTFNANAYAANDDLSDNFFGAVEGGKVVPTAELATSNIGSIGSFKLTQPFTTYYLDPECTLKNTDFGIAFEGDNVVGGSYITDPVLTATVKLHCGTDLAHASVTGLPEGATVLGIYTDPACTTLATDPAAETTLYAKVQLVNSERVFTITVDKAVDHSYTDWVVTDEPECTETGSRYRTCETCGYVDTEIMPELGHDLTDPVYIPPTCTEDAGLYITCTRCPEIFGGDAYPGTAQGHDMDVWKVVDAGDCTTDKVEERACKREDCDLVEQKITPAKGHIYGDWYVAEETGCDAPGLKQRDCINCDHIDTEVIAILPHTYGEFVVTLEPGCTVKGEQTRTCLECGHKDSYELPATGHSFEVRRTEPTCVSDGLEVTICTVCDYIDAALTTALPASNNYCVWGMEIINEATCIAPGTASRFCTVCYRRDESGVVATPLNPDNHANLDAEGKDYKPVSEGNCVEPAVSERTCPDCKKVDKKYDYEKVAGYHDYKLVTMPASYDQTGKHEKVCSVCGDTVLLGLIDRLPKFTDVSSKAWYAEYMSDAAALGLIKGYEDGSVRPEAFITRAEAVTMFARMAGVNTKKFSTAKFKDVEKKAWYNGAIAWAEQSKIVSGRTETTFDPNGNINRQELCTILVRYTKAQGIKLNKNVAKSLFADDAKIAKFAKESVYLCQRAEIVSGRPGNLFAPTAYATRAEVAKILVTFIKDYKLMDESDALAKKIDTETENARHAAVAAPIKEELAAAKAELTAAIAELGIEESALLTVGEYEDAIVTAEYALSNLSDPAAIAAKEAEIATLKKAKVAAEIAAEVAELNAKLAEENKLHSENLAEING